MKLLLFTISIFVFGCSATPSFSVDQLQQIQQDMEQLKRSNEESSAAIAVLNQMYDEKMKTYDEKLTRNDEKIASLEQQLRSGRTLVPQSGTVSFISFCLIHFYNIKSNVQFT